MNRNIEKKIFFSSRCPCEFTGMRDDEEKKELVYKEEFAINRKKRIKRISSRNGLFLF